MTDENKESPDFYGLGIAPKLLEILEQLKYTIPTPIQLKSIPISLEGKDIVGIAQTGTGKTLAFGIPMLQRLAKFKGRGLVLLPTRELAQQVDEHLKMIGQKLGLRTAVLIGGENINLQIKALKRLPHIIVATPGRLIDHLQNKHIKLDDVKVLVLDEADMMLDMGFMPQVETILKEVPKDRQTMLFSATMPPAIMRIVTRFMALPVSIEVAPAGTPAENVDQEMRIIKNEDKFPQLEKALNDYSGSVLIFTRTKHGAKNLCHKLNYIKFKAAEIHSNRTLIQRREALAGFKNGRFRILVATDIAARGIDVSGIELVVNYDLPDNSEDYVHRIGRTGRAGKTGRAISFATLAQVKDIASIERLIKKNFDIDRKLMGVYGRPPRTFSSSHRSIPNSNNQDKTRPSFYRKSENEKQRPKITSKYVKTLDDVFKPFSPFKEPAGDSSAKFSNRTKTGRPYSQSKFSKTKGPSGNSSRRPMTDKERFRKAVR